MVVALRTTTEKSAQYGIILGNNTGKSKEIPGNPNEIKKAFYARLYDDDIVARLYAYYAYCTNFAACSFVSSGSAVA